MRASNEITEPESQVEAGGIDTSQSRALRRPIRVIAASNLTVMAVGLLFLVQYWRLGATQIAWSLGLALAVVAVNLVFLHRTRKVKVAGYISTSAMFFVLMVIISRSGGFYDPTIAWLYVVPLAAAFLVDLTALLIFLGLVMAATVWFWLQPPGALPDLVPVDVHSVHSLFIRLAALFSLGAMTAFFVRSQFVAQNLLRRANRALEGEAEAHARTAEALGESEAQYRDLVENSADLIWTHDLDGVILGANESFVRALGSTRERIVGSGVEEFLTAESAGIWREYLETVRREGAYRGAMDVVDTAGQVKTLEFHNTLRDDALGPPIVRGQARDVTRQAEAQQALGRRVEQEQLMAAISTRFIDTGADQVPDAIASALGEIGSFLDCDRLSFRVARDRDESFETMCSWSRTGQETNGVVDSPALPWLRPRLEQFETVAFSDLAELEPESRRDLVALLGAQTRSAAVVPVFGRQGLIGLLTLEIRGSERRWLREDQALAHIAGSIFGNAIARVRDEELAQRLQGEIQQARKMESLGLIAGGIAHDFNNLLMVVLGNASLAMAQVPEGSGAQEALLAIDSSARRAAKLTAQMLAYSGGGTLDRRSTDLNEIVELELREMEERAESGIEVRSSLDPGLPEIFADAALLRQMLRAVLDNSVEAIGEELGVIQVTTGSVVLDDSAEVRGYRPIRRAVAAGAYAVLEVRDSGPGIPAGSLQKVFDPFFSTKFAGRGLGLAAALGVVRGHDGAIEVESDSSGTTMRILIPLLENTAKVRSVAAAEERAEAPDIFDPAVAVLEPDPAVLAVLAGLLTSRGFDAIQTTSADDLATILAREQDRICAVIADLASLESHASLRVNGGRTDRVPWIVTSDEGDEAVSQRLASVRASAFLARPFGGGRLLSLLEGLLRDFGRDGGAGASRQ